MQNEIEDRIPLPDGRRLGYRVIGPVEGRPLLYFHGFPGSRLEADWLRSEVANLSWRVYAIDRPGMGQSDFMPGRSLRDWPRDIAAFADAVGVKRFTVLGISGGGPYAAVCAWAMPQRVQAAGMVCSLGPLDDPRNLAGMASLNRGFFSLLRRFPKLSKPAYFPVSVVFKHWPLALLDAHANSLPLEDRAALRLPEFRNILANSFRESLRDGAHGGEHELRVLSAPWGFNLDEIRVPVGLWHGERDPIVPAAMGRRLEKAIPNCRATFFPDDGHYSLLLRWSSQIMGALSRIADGRAA